MKQVGAEFAHWHLLTGFMGLMALTVSKVQRHRQAPPMARVRDLGHSSWGRRRGDDYIERLHEAWRTVDTAQIEHLGEALRDCWLEKRQVFLCGNGGSAANAIHLANDLLYGIDKPHGRGMRVSALTANASVMTCLGNDTSYAEIFSRQLRAMAHPGDLLLVFSGSGNSANIVAALEESRRLGMTSFAILGYSGGRCLRLADHAIHFAVDDMQIAEDLQIMTGHMLSQWLYENRPALTPCNPS